MPSFNLEFHEGFRVQGSEVVVGCSLPGGQNVRTGLSLDSTMLAWNLPIISCQRGLGQCNPFVIGHYELPQIHRCH